jgi:hypothetical protein
MNSTPDLQGGDTFEGRLLQALTEVDERRPAALSPLLHVRRAGAAAPPRWSRLYWRRWWLRVARPPPPRSSCGLIGLTSSSR